MPRVRGPLSRSRRDELLALPWPGTGAEVGTPTRRARTVSALAAVTAVATLTAVLVVGVLAAAQAPYWDEPTEQGVVTAVSPLEDAFAASCRHVLLTVVVEHARPGYPQLVRNAGCVLTHGLGDVVALRRDAAHPDRAYVDPVPAVEVGLLAGLAFATVLALGCAVVLAGREDRHLATRVDRR